MRSTQDMEELKVADMQNLVSDDGDKASNKDNKADPIAQTLKVRKKLKLGEERISQLEADQKKIKVYRAQPPHGKVKGKIEVDYTKKKASKSKKAEPKPEAPPTPNE